jgi:hypothetical protein
MIVPAGEPPLRRGACPGQVGRSCNALRRDWLLAAAMEMRGNRIFRAANACFAHPQR